MVSDLHLQIVDGAVGTAIVMTCLAQHNPVTMYCPRFRCESCTRFLTRFQVSSRASIGISCG